MKANIKLERHIYLLAQNCRKQWSDVLCASENIEEYGLNEFYGGKADAFEECLYLIRKNNGMLDSENSIFVKYENL